MAKQGRRAAQAPRKSKTPYVVGGLALLAILVVVVALSRTSGQSGTPEERFHLNASPSMGLATHSLGVTVVAFESPQCPSCRIFHHGIGDGGPSTFDRLDSEFFQSGKVAYVEKTFFVGWPWERQGAAAQKCAWHEDAKLFFALTKSFYADQDRITVTNFDSYLEQWGTTAGIDGAKLVQCAKNNPHASEIDQDVRDGQRAGVSGTPTYFIVAPSGKTRTIVGPQSFDTFARAIQDASAA